MLNKEKFEKEIIEIACAGNSISMVGGELCGCIGNYCVRCDFSKKYGAEECEKAIQEWANSEYVEEIDWSKVEDGTRIWVRNFEIDEWLESVFAFELKGRVICYKPGFEKVNFPIYHTWRYARLDNPYEEKQNGN